MDGIGPREKRPTMINTHWGGVTENNHFGTHEFLDLCEQLGCEPYICGNVGSGTVREMQQWVEYMTSDGVSPMADLRRQNGREKPWKLTYFGVGNENWGCGGIDDARVLRRPVPALRHLRPELRRQPHLQDRLRPQRRRLPVDRGADARGGPADGRPGAALLLRHRRRRAARPPSSARTTGSPCSRRRCGWRS